jgi:hypothetical protein
MFLYYLPGERTANADTLAKHGIGYAFDSLPSYREIFSGPDQSAGIIASRHPDIDRLGYHPSKQQWRKIPGKTAWVGKWTEEAITPEQLARPDQCSGLLVRLADGQLWNVARARKFVEHDQQSYYVCPLPHDLDLGDDGRWIPARVSAAYAKLSDLADQFWEAHSQSLADDEKNFVFERLDDLCVAAIAANYHVEAIELAILRAYTINSRRAVLDAVLDLEFSRAMLQKKTGEAPVGSATTPGPTPVAEGSRPATPQPTAS